jgi:hypothetical protein
MTRLTSVLTLALIVIALPIVTKTSASQDQPTIAKDSIQITAFTFNVYKGNYDNWSWVPRMQFRVNGRSRVEVSSTWSSVFRPDRGSSLIAAPTTSKKVTGGRPSAAAATFRKTKAASTPAGQFYDQDAQRARRH